MVPREWFPRQQQTGRGLERRTRREPRQDLPRRGGGDAEGRRDQGRWEGERGEGRMQGPDTPLLLSAGELGPGRRVSASWYSQGGGPVCNWLRKPQPLEPRTSFPLARRSEFRPPRRLPWPGPASAQPEEGHAGGRCQAGSPAPARRLGRAFKTLVPDTHAQGAADPRPLGPPHTRVLDDPSPQDGEAPCGAFTLAYSGCEDYKMLGWGEGMGVGRRTAEGGHPDEGRRQRRGVAIGGQKRS